MNAPDPRLQARAIALHACDLTPEHVAALETLRGDLALALHGRPSDWALAFQDAVLACRVAPLLFPGQRGALITPLVTLLQELLEDAPAPRALQAVP